MSEEPSQYIERLLQDIRDRIPLYAKAKAERVHLEHFRKSDLSRLRIEAEQVGRKTAQEREDYARTHPDYLAMLEELKSCTEKEEGFRLGIKAREMELELFRTQQASLRMERKAYNA